MRTLIKVVVAMGLGMAILATAPVTLAQKKEKEDTTVRSVSGIVTDDAGNPVEGAAVHLKNTKTLQIRSFISKPDGSYSFHGLSTNVDYELKAESKGNSSDTKTLSVFDSRNKAIINLKVNTKKS
jgi:hypothetical protein